MVNYDGKEIENINCACVCASRIMYNKLGSRFKSAYPNKVFDVGANRTKYSRNEIKQRIKQFNRLLIAYIRKNSLFNEYSLDV